MAENQQQQPKEDLAEVEKAKKIIMEAIKATKDASIVESGSTTGFSYFKGKKRLCKLLKTKRGVALEINVQLPETVSKLAGMDTISKGQATKKHLGTMKHMYRSGDAKEVLKIIQAALKVFITETKEVAKEEAKAPDQKPAQAQ